MGLKEKITTDMKLAMKSADQMRKNVTRMLLSEIKYAQTAVDAKIELEESAVLKVVSAYHKKMTKSLDDYPEGDSKNALRQELSVIEEYLPKAASDQEVEQAVDAVLASTQERAFGPLMKLVVEKLGGQANGKVISEKLKSKLG